MPDDYQVYLEFMDYHVGKKAYCKKKICKSMIFYVRKLVAPSKFESLMGAQISLLTLQNPRRPLATPISLLEIKWQSN